MGKSERTTILIDADLKKKVLLLMAERIKLTNTNISFSTVINQILRAYFK